jgi:hypothetical protein
METASQKPGSKTDAGRAKQANKGISKHKLRELAANRAIRAAEHLAKGIPANVVRGLIQAEFAVYWKTAAADIVRAKDNLLAATSETIELQRGMAYATYQAVKQRQDARPELILKAQERIDKLLGLELQPGATITVGINVLAVSEEIVRPEALDGR